MNVGIIGHASEKFTPVSQSRAIAVIRGILVSCSPDVTVVSGRSPMGGVDVWAEELAEQMGFGTQIFAPKVRRWSGPGGFKERNERIALFSDEVHVVVVDDYPPGYAGMRFKLCYHCGLRDHVKSGACWTARRAKEEGKPVVLHVVSHTM